LLNPITTWRNFLARDNNDRVKVFGIAILVAFVSAAVISTASVTLRPLQDAHLEAERLAKLDAMLDRLPAMRTVMLEAGADALETRLVDLATGAFVPDIDPESYDAEAAAKDPEKSVAIPTDADVAGLQRRAPYAPVYLLESRGDLQLVMLPVSGVGYQSTLRAMLALEADLTTVAALTILEQGETAGLGARIEEPEWQAQWQGKQVANEEGETVIAVVRGKAANAYEVDGISGASRTGNGITNMLRYWLGDHGFGPFMDRLKQEGF
jgi:Na+-transporting NADH:ubiquinone oxidoreductase subunit C